MFVGENNRHAGQLQLCVKRDAIPLGSRNAVNKNAFLFGIRHFGRHVKGCVEGSFRNDTL